MRVAARGAGGRHAGVMAVAAAMAVAGTLTLSGCGDAPWAVREEREPLSVELVSQADCPVEGGHPRPGNAAVTRGGDIVGEGVAEKVWNYMRAAGYSEAACAAALGNAEAESGMDPGADNNWSDGHTSRGLWQFTDGIRREFEAWSGGDWSVERQVEWMFGPEAALESHWADYSTNPGLGNGTYYTEHGASPGMAVYHTVAELKAGTDVTTATFSWMACYERCRNEGSRFDARLEAARQWYERLSGKAATAAGTAKRAGKCEPDGNGTSFLNAEEVFFTQWDPQSDWQGLPYWDHTMGSAGCGPTSLTIIVDILTGRSYTPRDMWEARKDYGILDQYNGHDNSIPEDFFRREFQADIHYEPVADNTLEGWKAALGDGRSVILFSRGSGSRWYEKGGVPSRYQHASGHFSVCWKYQDGKFYVKDCSLMREQGNNVEYDEEMMRQFIDGRDYSQTRYWIGGVAG